MESLTCSNCGSRMNHVIETRSFTWMGVFLKMRTRECNHCHHRFRTKEIQDNNITYSDRPLKTHPPFGRDLPDNPHQKVEPAPPEAKEVNQPFEDSANHIIEKKPKRTYKKKKKDPPTPDLEDPPSDNIGDSFFPPM